MCEIEAMNPFAIDELGRTALHRACEQGDRETAWDLLNQVAGTGVSPQRQSLLEMRDHSGRTAADAADAAGYVELAAELRGEWMRMDFFE